MKIKIHKDTWKVKLVDANAEKMNSDENGIKIGITEYLEGVINIRKEIPESIARATVIHELVHAFIFSYGYTINGEEAMCDFFAVHGDEIVSLTDRIMKEVVLC